MPKKKKETSDKIREHRDQWKYVQFFLIKKINNRNLLDTAVKQMLLRPIFLLIS